VQKFQSDFWKLYFKVLDYYKNLFNLIWDMYKIRQNAMHQYGRIKELPGIFIFYYLKK
jgi:hypothetical protein